MGGCYSSLLGECSSWCKCGCCGCSKKQELNIEEKQWCDVTEQESLRTLTPSSSSCSSSLSSSSNSASIIIEDIDTECYLFGEDEYVRVRIKGCTTWLESHIIDILENGKYRIRIHRSPEYDKYIKNKYIRIMDQESIRKNSKIVDKITSDSHIETDVIDLYLNGRECQLDLEELSKIIEDIHNSMNKHSFRDQRRYNMSYMQSRYISIEILNYCFDEKYHWRLHCFWCKQFKVKMVRSTCRSHVICAGATNIGHYGDTLSLMAFCDECNTEMDYEDYSFRCINHEHDICLKCLWQKIQTYHKLNNLIKSIHSCLDVYTLQCIVQCVVGDIRKF